MVELGEVGHHGELVWPGRGDQVLHLQQRRDAETLVSKPECQAQVPEKFEREVNTQTQNRQWNVIVSIHVTQTYLKTEQTLASVWTMLFVFLTIQ